MEFYIFFAKSNVRHLSRFLPSLTSIFNAKMSFSTFVAVSCQERMRMMSGLYLPNVINDIYHGFRTQKKLMTSQYCPLRHSSRFFIQVTIMTMQRRPKRHSSRKLLPRNNDDFKISIPTRLLWHSSRFFFIKDDPYVTVSLTGRPLWRSSRFQVNKI